MGERLSYANKHVVKSQICAVRKYKISGKALIKTSIILDL